MSNEHPEPTVPTFERMNSAAMEFFNERMSARMQEGRGVPVAMADALRDTIEHLLAPVHELLKDVNAHGNQESAPVEVRTLNGSWRDVESYFEGIVR